MCVGGWGVEEVLYTLEAYNKLIRARNVIGVLGSVTVGTIWRV